VIAAAFSAMDSKAVKPTREVMYPICMNPSVGRLAAYGCPVLHSARMSAVLAVQRTKGPSGRADSHSFPKEPDDRYDSPEQ